MGRTGTYYLNNSGSRWVILTNGKRDSLTLLTKGGKTITRQVEFWSSFGNFATPYESLEEALQDVVKCNNTDYITVEGAYTCSKMRPGEFGGFAVFITEDDCEHFGTTSWLRGKLEEHRVRNN